MDRETIEANDQRLTKQFRDIIAQKEKTGHHQKTARSALVPVGVIIVALIAGITVWALKDAPVIQDDKPAAVQTQHPEPVVPPHQVAESVEPVPASEPVLSTEAEEALSPAETQTLEPPVTPTALSITEIVPCSQVSDRAHDAPKHSFSLKENIKPIVWMEVNTDVTPQTLTHAYYVNGGKYCEVPLAIRYPRTRTWSHITLSSENQIGQWRVYVITENGEVLKEVSFQVTP